MPTDPFYKSHWRDIEPDRMAAYRESFGWDAATARLFAPAKIKAGQIVADFGCGPGKVAVELARQVASTGHVHAIDINADFLEIARQNAQAAAVQDWFSTHLNDGSRLLLDDAMVDRVTVRNALMYVDDPVGTIREFHRVLRPGGLAHAIEGDWYMMVAEPVPHELWHSFVRAASHACRTSDMGRKMRPYFAEAGFEDVEVSISAPVDTDGRLLGMIRNMAGYARESGKMARGDTEEVVRLVEEALADGRYMVVSPLFVATAIRP